MKLVLKQKGLRQFTVLFHKNNVHSFHLPEDHDLAHDRIYQIISETVPSIAQRDFFDGIYQTVSSLARSHRENRPTSFYCGAVCLTLER